MYINSKPFKILNCPRIQLFLFSTDQYFAFISWLIAMQV